MAERPKFSILLPTRNRAFIIANAIESMLTQTYGDWELVISNNHSEDDTESVVRRFEDPRIRYYRTDRPLSMPKNWRYVLSLARGEWVIYLEDDNVQASRALELIARATEDYPGQLVTWPYLGYMSNEISDPSRRNQYVNIHYSGRASYRDSLPTLRNLYGLRADPAIPRMYNCAVRHDLVEALERKMGGLCQPPAPDYTSAAALLGSVPRFTYLDIPLMLSNVGATSPHASQKAYANFQKELDEENRGGYTPIKLPHVSTCNIIPESLCKTKQQMPDELREVDLDLESYVPYYAMELVKFEDEGWRLEPEREALKNFLNRLPVAQRVRIGAHVLRAYAKYTARRRLGRVAFRHQWLLALLERASGRDVVRGDEAGFNTILGALRHLETRLYAHAS